MSPLKTPLLYAALTACLAVDNIYAHANSPEQIDIEQLPLPPVVQSLEPGSCNRFVNFHDTGCIGQTTGLQGGNFLPDGRHVMATVKFAGAPAAPDPRSIYQGQQLIVIKTDGTFFPNGDSWKCLTCGVPENQAIGLDPHDTKKWGYPQAFKDGTRALAGHYIVECERDFPLVSDDCGPQQIHIYPIRMENTEEGTGRGAALRELRIHPDDTHIGVNVFSTSGGKLGQTAYIGRLHFNSSPTTGLPLASRYDIVSVNQLLDPNSPQPVSVQGDELFINNSAISIGELRGFSGTGAEVVYIGYPHESCNIDVFAANLRTGAVRRLTTHPGYVDPVQFSPDDASIITMDTRGNSRVNFMSGMRSIPPVLDLLTATACASVRNNGQRRFFQPWLLGAQGDYSPHPARELNAASTGRPGTGAINDPEWNGRADPWFSPDGTQILYWQAQTRAPACGSPNPLPCYPSHETGNRKERLMLATLGDRAPISTNKTLTTPAPDTIPWALPYNPGTTPQNRPQPPPGTYNLPAPSSGTATVHLTSPYPSPNQALTSIHITYHNFSSDNNQTFLTGTQNATLLPTNSPTLTRLHWTSDLHSTDRDGRVHASQLTSLGGFELSIDAMTNIFHATGTLKTVVGGREWEQPAEGQGVGAEEPESAKKGGFLGPFSGWWVSADRGREADERRQQILT
ncbi:hypothetical protein MBLNU230_g7035t1 [Neophaeotheca triangularis]